MTDRIRYYFDEHLPDAAAAGLVARGIDVLTADDAGRTGTPDDEQLRFATADGRVLVSHDEDYLAWAARFLAAGEPFAGIAYCLPARFQGHVGRLVHALADLHARRSAADMLNHVEYL